MGQALLPIRRPKDGRADPNPTADSDFLISGFGPFFVMAGPWPFEERRRFRSPIPGHPPFMIQYVDIRHDGPVLGPAKPDPSAAHDEIDGVAYSLTSRSASACREMPAWHA